jgi:hypothetical protein
MNECGVFNMAMLVWDCALVQSGGGVFMGVVQLPDMYVTTQRASAN